MPSWELFEMQPEAYRESVIPSTVTSRIAVEAGVGLGWERYTGQSGAFVGMRSYGASAPYKEAYAGFGITVEQILGEARKLIS
jgi:transketolase